MNHGQVPEDYVPYPSAQGAAFDARMALQARLVSNSTVVLVISIVGIFFTGLILGPVSWIWGNRILEEAAQNGIPREAVKNAATGKTIGMIITILYAVGAALALIVLGLAVANQ